MRCKVFVYGNIQWTDLWFVGWWGSVPADSVRSPERSLCRGTQPVHCQQLPGCYKFGATGWKEQENSLNWHEQGKFKVPHHFHCQHWDVDHVRGDDQDQKVKNQHCWLSGQWASETHECWRRKAEGRV